MEAQGGPPLQLAVPDALEPVETDRRRTETLRWFRAVAQLHVSTASPDWAQRRELVRVAEHLGIDALTAHLLIRAVEIELGVSAEGAVENGRDEPAADRRSLAGALGAWPFILPPLLVGAMLLLQLVGPSR